MSNLITPIKSEKVKVKKQIQSSHWLLLNSLLWSGIGFVIVGLLSIGYSFLIINNFSEWLQSQNYTIASSIVLIAFVFLSIFINIKWSTNVINSSWTLISAVWIIDILLMTGMIAPLVTLINNPWLVFTVIACSGAMFVLVGGLGYLVMTVKTAMNLSKLLWFIFIGLFAFNLIFMLTFSFMYTNSFSIYYLVFDICYLIISLIVLGLTFFSISKSGQLYQELDKQQKTKLGSYFGLQLLLAYVILLVSLLRLVSNFRN